MSKAKSVKELMIDVFEYPHIPYWFTIRQAMGLMKKSLIDTEKCVHPLAMLIFDQKYNLMGIVTLKDILKGLEPRLMKPVSMADPDVSFVDETAMAGIEAGLFDEESKKLAERPVNDIMVPVSVFVSPDDSAVKAAFMMVNSNLTLLPVLEDRKKLIGLIRMLEVYKEVSGLVS